jgi:hypothetical protein
MPGCPYAHHQTAGADLNPLGLMTRLVDSGIHLVDYPTGILHAFSHIVCQFRDF